MMDDAQGFHTVSLNPDVDVIAPDGSEIRLLPATADASMCHCTLPPGQVSSAVAHRQIEEIWYVLEGAGELWRRNESAELVSRLVAGTGLTISPRTSFQFRNTGDGPFRILIVTMPPWPGPEEAEPVPGLWAPSHP